MRSARALARLLLCPGRPAAPGASPFVTPTREGALSVPSLSAHARPPQPVCLTGQGPRLLLPRRLGPPCAPRGGSEAQIGQAPGRAQRPSPRLTPLSLSLTVHGLPREQRSQSRVRVPGASLLLPALGLRLPVSNRGFVGPPEQGGGLGCPPAWLWLPVEGGGDLLGSWGRGGRVLSRVRPSTWRPRRRMPGSCGRAGATLALGAGRGRGEDWGLSRVPLAPGTHLSEPQCPLVPTPWHWEVTRMPGISAPHLGSRRHGPLPTQAGCCPRAHPDTSQPSFLRGPSLAPHPSLLWPLRAGEGAGSFPPWVPWLLVPSWCPAQGGTLPGPGRLWKSAEAPGVGLELQPRGGGCLGSLGPSWSL